MENRKNILKEAGVLLVAAILVLTAIVIVPMTMATPPEHDVGVTAIEEPTSGCASDWDATFPVEVTVHNFGQYGECCFKTYVEIGEVGPSGTYLPPEFGPLFKCIATIASGEELTLDFGEWKPKRLEKGNPFCNEYYVKAWTDLQDPLDQNAKNDCLIKIITINTPAVAAVEEINEYIQDLGVDAFSGPPPPVANKKKTFSNKLNAVINKLINEVPPDYAGAIDKLDGEIRDNINDWIIDPTAQQELCDMIDALIVYLETMI